MSGPGQSGWGNDQGGGYGGPPADPSGPAWGQPGHGRPGYGRPGYGQDPGYGQPGYGQDSGHGGQPAYGQPAYGQPGHGSEPSYGGPPTYGDPYGQPTYPPTTEQGYGTPGGPGGPGGYGGYGGYGTGAPAPKKGNGARNAVIAIVAVVVLVGGGLGIAAGLGAFSGDDTPVARGTSTAPSTPDFGTGSPTAGQSSGSSRSSSADPSADPTGDETGSSASGDYDPSPPSESDARDAVDAFLSATNDKDVDGALDYVCPDIRDDFRTKLEGADTDAETAFAVDFDNSEFVDSTVDDNARVLDYTLDVTLDDDGRSATLDYSVTMQSLDGDALICGRQFKEK